MDFQFRYKCSWVKLRKGIVLGIPFFPLSSKVLAASAKLSYHQPPRGKMAVLFSEAPGRLPKWTPYGIGKLQLLPVHPPHNKI